MSDPAQRLVQAIPLLRCYARTLLHDRQLADDLVQDALERAWRSIRSWHGGDIRPWVFSILHNVYLNEVRRGRARPVLVPWTIGMTEPADPGRPDDSLRCRDILAGLSALSDEQRQVMLLVGLEEFTYQQVANILSIPIGTVMSRLSRARRDLRAALQMDAPARRTTRCNAAGPHMSADR